jgi:RHS repeat-associated protein
LDEVGAVISYEEYYPYGSTSFQVGRSSTEVSLKRYRYTGKERDEETGLYYHGARYYIPWLARWSAVDPLQGEMPEWSSYCYVYCNAVMWVDCNGMSPEEQKPTNWESTEGKEFHLDYDKKGDGDKNENKNSDELTLFIYANISVSDEQLDESDMEQVRNEILEIFRKNKIPLRVEIIKDPKKGDEMYDQWKSGKLPINQAVLQFTNKDTEDQLGNTNPWFFSETPVFEVNIREVVRASENQIFRLAAPKTEILGYAAAHEALHYFLDAAAYTLGGARSLSDVKELLHMDRTGHENSSKNLNAAVIGLYKPIEEGDKVILPVQKSLLMNFAFYIATGIEGLKSKAINDLQRYGQR